MAGSKSGTGVSIAARRYAEAAFGIARDRGTYAQWQEDLSSIAQLVDDPTAGPYLASLRVGEADKRRLLERALDIGPLAKNLALLLLQRGRLHLAGQLSAEFERLYNAEHGIALAEVTTAVPVSDAEERAIAARLQEITGAREVRLQTRVDPAIIGGMVARVGDRLIDGSTRTRLVQLRRALAGESR